jgi:hypothetical protein
MDIVNPLTKGWSERGKHVAHPNVRRSRAFWRWTMEDTPEKSNLESKTIDSSTSLETRAEEFSRKWAPPLVLTGVSFWGLFMGEFLAYHSWKGGFINRIVEEHFPGMILVPLAALMALCIVLMLRWTAGVLEFDLWGQAKLKGASRPLTLWVISVFWR